MADNKGVMFKSVQKHAGRAKEKILQNLGKVDRTADDIFDDHLNNFNRQQCNANKFQKEFNNYIRCIRAAQTASKSLLDAISEVYEPQWSGYDALQAQTAASESLWQDFTHKLGDQVLIPLNTYTGQFPEMKKKIEKRNRKLIDYDGQRHSFQNLQANANKRKDDVKLTKGREQLEEARRTYEILNTELHDELPALYDSRILFLVTNLQTLFATEQVFHHETSKIYSEFEAIVDKLATESQRGSNTLRKHTPNAVKSSSPVQSPVKQISNYQNQITTNGSSNINSTEIPSQSEAIRSSPQDERRLDSISPTPDSTPENRNTATISPTSTATSDPSYQNVMGFIDPTATTSSLKISENDDTHNGSANSTIVNGNATTIAAAKPTTTAAQEDAVATPPLPLSVPPALATEVVSPSETVGKVAKTAKTIPQLSNENNNNEDKPTEREDNKAALVGNSSSANVDNKTPRVSDISKNPFGDEESDSIYEIPEVATTTDLPPGVLYKVKATYSYVKEDVDELSFEIGDIISVIEYDDPEDQEEGWLMGAKDGTDEKGLFPANFTRPI